VPIIVDFACAFAAPAPAAAAPAAGPSGVVAAAAGVAASTTGICAVMVASVSRFGFGFFGVTAGVVAISIVPLKRAAPVFAPAAGFASSSKPQLAHIAASAVTGFPHSGQNAMQEVSSPRCGSHKTPKALCGVVISRLSPEHSAPLSLPVGAGARRSLRLRLPATEPEQRNATLSERE
jgi:hypothetical protein